MKRTSIVILAWCLIGVVIPLLIWKFPGVSVASSSAGSQVQRVKPHTDSTSKPEIVAAPARTKLTPIETDNKSPDEIHADIQTAVITYSPDGVKPIAKYLLDSDPEVREAARQGLRILGERDAIPLLRQAAKRLEANEAQACEEAAAFLELPSWSETDEAKAISQELNQP